MVKYYSNVIVKHKCQSVWGLRASQNYKLKNKMRNTNLQKSSQWNTFNFGKVKNFTRWPRGIATKEYCRFSDNPTWQHSTVVKKSFTLVKLMIVIAILAILSAIVIFTLNPGRLFDNFRDTRRVTDITSIHKAINFMETWNTSMTYGTSTFVYISIPAVNANCSDIAGLPTLPAGYTYACSSQANYKKTDGTGWTFFVNFLPNLG